MDDEHLRNQLDMLWNRVQGKHDGSEDFRSAFDMVQSELQSESVNALRSRFEKEKTYWKNLLASKEEMIQRLQERVKTEEENERMLKLKIEELRNGEADFIKQSFAALEMQKKTSEMRTAQLEKEIESLRKEALELKLVLKEEKETEENLRRETEEKEKKWIEQFDNQEAQIQRERQNLYERRQKELLEIAHLEETIKNLQTQSTDNQRAFDAEKAAIQNLLKEREIRIEKLREELQQTTELREKEREERQMAAMEREKESIQAKEDRKRLVEQLLSNEEKIKELQESMETMQKEKNQWDVALSKKEQELVLQDEFLRKRREEWVDSIKNQSGKQMDISEKVVDLLSRLEFKSTVPGETQTAEASVTSAESEAAEEKQNLKSKSSVRNFIGILQRGFYRVYRKIGGWGLVAAGLLLFGSAATLWYLNDSGRKISKAQEFLRQGNDLFTRGDLNGSLSALQTAYQMDPANSIIKNSLTLVLGEIANKDFKDGKYEDALKKTETLNQMLPEDPDVIHLHDQILKALAKKGGTNLEESVSKDEP